MSDTPRSIAGYQLRERLAVGGMAEIFRAVRVGPGAFEKTVAVKTVLPDLGRDAQFVQMFLEEARLGARLSSPRLVQVFDFGEQDGTYYLVMEHVDGLDLAALLGAAGPLPLPLGLHLGDELCAALRDLHGATDEQHRPLHIVHRDVNPGNVLLSCAGDVKLGDFGIAKARARSLRTERGAIKGKLAYLAPEQVRGEEVDARADLYAVGLILFEALTGERYLAGETEAELLRDAGAPCFRPASRLAAGVPPWLDEVLERALAPEPARRYPDAAALGEALRGGGPPRDPARLRQQLGALVTRGQRSPQAAPPVGRPAPLVAAAAAARPGGARGATEILSPRAATRGGALLRWLGLLAFGIALAALAFLAAHQRSRVDTPPRVDDARAMARDLRPASPRDAGRHAGRDLPHAQAASHPDARARRHLRPQRGDARAGAASAAADLGRPPALPSGVVLADLAELDRALAEKGILAEDAPQLWAERQALARAAARGAADGAAAQRLLERARALRVDRAFVDAKLSRVTARLARATLEGSLAEELRQRARRALSYAVTGRYTEANRELNVIHRRLQPP